MILTVAFLIRKSKAALSSKKGLPAEPTEASKLKLGLFSYPVLQAADILLYRYVAEILSYYSRIKKKEK